jgi:putative photosynthetic complex assembly protein
MNPARPSGHTALPLPVRLLGSLLLLVLLAVGWARWAGVSVQFADPPTLWARELRFVDDRNGDVLALDPRSGDTVARFSGEQGFVRGTLRALARERQRNGLGAETPLQLVGHQDGRLTLHDPATGERIGLEAFGSSNLAVFAALRPAPAPIAHRTAPDLPERKTP